jgi:hypothetical protein
VRALARAVRYARWRATPPGTIPALEDIDLAAARGLVQRVLEEAPDGRELHGEEAAALLGTLGLVLSFEQPADTVPVELAVFDERSLGALVSFSIGGVTTELLGDVAYAAAPLTERDAEQLIHTPRSAPLLTGYRGATPCDTAALADLALRLSALGEGLPEIAECRLTVLATPIGAQVSGIRARVAPPTARTDTGPRRLRGF